MTPAATNALYVGVGVLVAWRVYSRIRRMVGRQRLSKYRPWITLTVFPLIVALIAVASVTHPSNLAALAVALAAGAALGAYGLRRTKFEAIPGQGFFYTPNAHLGIALSLLFIGRLAYRAYEVYVVAPGMHRDSAEFARSPLTLAVFGLLAGYYISYAVGLLRWRRRVLHAKAAREATPKDDHVD